MSTDYFAGLDQASPPRLQLASLIDMSFLMLIFFLVSATLQKQEADLDLLLPGVSLDAPASTLQVEQMRVTIDDHGEIRVNGSMLSTRTATDILPVLTDRLTRYAAVVNLSGAAPQVVIRCSGAAAEQRFIDVLNACRRAGIEQIQLSQ
jgi:biopolymer transport protein ExbD